MLRDTSPRSLQSGRAAETHRPVALETRTQEDSRDGTLRYLLVRHATARPDGPRAHLTPEGRVEAEALARRLKGCSFSAAWSSDMDRAVSTACAILVPHQPLPLHISPALREMEFPEGIDPVATPAQYRAWESEAVAMLAERLSEWLRESASAVPGSPHPDPLPRGEGVPPLSRGEGRGEDGPLSSPTILVVSHGGPLRVLICLLLGLPPDAHWSFHLDHAGLTVLDRSEQMGTLMLLNDRCHLNGKGCAHGG